MTAQEPDEIVVHGEVGHLLDEPLEPYLVSLGDRRPKFFAWSTANWRGYLAGWEIDDDALVLTQVSASVVGPDGEDELRDDEAVPGLELPCVAAWMTGPIRIGFDDVSEYVHAGYASRWARELYLDIDRGRVVGRRWLAGDELTGFPPP